MVKSLIIFDCDGTLVDSEALNLRALLDVITGFGVTEYDLDQAYKLFTGLRFSKIIEKVTAQTGFTFPEDAGMRYRARVRELAEAELQPIPGAYEMVEAAARQSKICVASNGERGNVLFSLQKVGLLDLFEEQHIFTGLMVENPKPAPDLFMLAAKELNAPAQHTLVIEDSPTGVQAGIAAGMTVWGFSGAHHDPRSQETLLMEKGAAQVFQTMTDLKEALTMKAPQIALP